MYKGQQPNNNEIKRSTREATKTQLHLLGRMNFEN